MAEPSAVRATTALTKHPAGAMISSVSEVSVTIGGEVESPPPAPEPPKRWLAIGAAGVVAGLLLGLGFRGSPDPIASDTTVQSDIDAPPAVTTTSVATTRQVDRLAIKVPGLIDDLVIWHSTLTGATEVAVWYASAPSPRFAFLPEGDYGTDSFHSWVSAFGSSRYSTDEILWVGNQAYAEPLATKVLGSTWHEQHPGRIAWSARGADGSITLSTVNLLPGVAGVPAEVVRSEDLIEPVWWTSEGIVVFDGERLQLLDSDTGALKNELPATGLLAGSDQYAIITHDSGALALIDRTLEVLRPLPIPVECLSGAFAPLGTPVFRETGEGVWEGQWLAMVCGTGLGNRAQTLQLWAIHPMSEELVAEIRGGSGVVEPAWTPDGRMVAFSVVDPIRPTTTLVFYAPVSLAPGADEPKVYEVEFPGRIYSLQIIKNR